MEIEIFTICDHAENFGGKLVIVGTFDYIRSQSFPMVHSHCSIALRMRFAESEVGNHQVQLRFIDDSGKMLKQIDGNLNVQNPIEGIGYSTVNTVLTFGNLPFEHSGRYSFELYIDGEWMRGIPLNLLLNNNQLSAA